MTMLAAGQKLALYWVLTLAFETVLALHTFKTRLAAEGMPAESALVYASLWEGAHLFLLAVVIPGFFLFVTWQYLQRVRLGQWTVERMILAWCAVSITFYLAMMVETVVAETILPQGAGYLVRGAYGVCVSLTGAMLVLTLKWLRHPAVS